MIIRAAEASLNQIAQPDSSIPGSDIRFNSNGIYYPTHMGIVCRCRSTELKSTGTDGVLMVHLVQDPADRWYELELSAGTEKGRYFDAVKQTGTTVSLSDITLFPCA